MVLIVLVVVVVVVVLMAVRLALAGLRVFLGTLVVLVDRLLLAFKAFVAIIILSMTCRGGSGGNSSRLAVDVWTLGGT